MRRAALGVGEVREETGPQIRGGARQEMWKEGSGSGEETAFEFAVVDFSGAEAGDFGDDAEGAGDGEVREPVVADGGADFVGGEARVGGDGAELFAAFRVVGDDDGGFAAWAEVGEGAGEGVFDGG